MKEAARGLRVSRRWLRVGAVVGALVLFAGAAFVGYVSWKSADSLIHPARNVASATPADVGVAFEDVSFATADDVTLDGWWMTESVEGHNGTVVFLHGYGESKNQSLKVAPFLVAHGYDVLAFDFRAHGESEGDVTTVGLVETRDVEAALLYVASRPEADVDRVALIGFSMGAATALNAAGSLPQVDAVIADSAFATLTNIASNSITHFTGLPKYPYGPLSVMFAGWMVGHDVGDNRPIDRAAALDVPLLVIQGEADTIAFPDDDGRALATAAAAATYWLVPQATHVRAVDVEPESYAARVLDFLGQHVATAS